MFILWLLVVHTSCYSQGFSINQDSIKEMVYLNNSEILVYQDTSQLSFKDISSADFQANFSHKKRSISYSRNSTIWLKFTIENTSNKRREFVLFSNDWDVEFFCTQTQTNFFSNRQGVLVNTYNNKFYSGNNAEGKIIDYLLPSTSKTYFVKTPSILYYIAFKDFDFIGIQDKAFVEKKALFDLWSIGIYVGVLFLILVSITYLIKISFKVSYIFYAAYCITHVLFYTGYYQIPSLFSFNWPISHSLFLPLTASSYLLFVHYYLDLSKHNKTISKIFKLYTLLSFIAFIVLLYLNLTDMVGYYSVLPKINITNLGFLLFSTFLITRIPGELKFFIIAGTLFIASGSIITWTTQYNNNLAQSFFFSIFGNALEKITFLFGIFYMHNQEQLAAQTKLLNAKKQLEFNEQQLRNFSNSIKEKNKLIEAFKGQIEKSEATTSQKHENLLQLTNAIILTDDDWEDFKKLYEKTHPRFFFDLKHKYPKITNAEIRLVALLKLNLSNKEVAGMLGISPDSVIKTKYRLKKKLSDAESVNFDTLIEYL